MKGSCNCPNFMIPNNLNQCICDPLSTIIAANGCYKCSNDPYSTGKVLNTSACECKSRFSWTLSCQCLSPFVLLNDSCGCPSLQIISSSGSCICDPSKTITYDQNICYSCQDVVYSTGVPNNPNNGSCACLSRFFFIWDANKKQGSCICPSLMIPNSVKQCVCDSNSTITTFSGCTKCSDISFALQYFNNNSCSCLSTFTWNPLSFQC
jgi:hypothetical protein